MWASHLDMRNEKREVVADDITPAPSYPAETSFRHPCDFLKNSKSISWILK